MSHCSPEYKGLTELKKNNNHLYVIVFEGYSLLCFRKTSHHPTFSITFL